MSPSETVSPTVDVLMRKYALLKQEIWLHMGYYKGHVARFQLMGTAILAAGAYIIAHVELWPNDANWWFWWIAASFIPVMAHYLMYDIIESQYATILLGERMATIEEDINRTLGERVLIWETFAAPRFWSVFRPLPGLFNPDWLLSIFGVIIAVANAAALPCYLYWNLWTIATGSNAKRSAALLGAICTLSAIIITLYIAARILLGMRGRPREYLRAVLSAASGLESATRAL